MRYCSDVALELGLSVEEGYLPRECCNSCHDDFNEGYEDLIWMDDDTQVCCAILRLAEEQAAREMLEHQRKRHEAETLAAAEQSMAEVYTNDCPPPLSCHPFYRGKTWLIDWLNGDSSLPEWDIMIPLPTRPLMASFTVDPDPIALPSMKAMRMSKQRAWGPAPWVGEPFHYEWFVGTDELGRRCAGESRIVYEEGVRRWQALGLLGLHP